MAGPCRRAGAALPAVADGVLGRAVIVAADGATVLAEGWSRAEDPKDHAEEAALRGFTPADPRLVGATIYSSLEPCSQRASRPRTCTQLILTAGIRRVVYAWREPAVFVDCQGVELLAAAGVAVLERPDLAAGVRAGSAHLLPGAGNADLLPGAGNADLLPGAGNAHLLPGAG